jgi:hypothetical protein
VQPSVEPEPQASVPSSQDGYDTAIEELNSAVSSLKDEVDRDVNLTYPDALDEIKRFKKLARTDLEDARTGNNEVCDVPENVRADRDSAKESIGYFEADMAQTDDLESGLADLQAAEAKVREFDPADAALSDSYGLESQAKIKIMTINDANQQAIDKMKKAVKGFKGYIAQAERLAAAANC